MTKFEKLIIEYPKKEKERMMELSKFDKETLLLMINQLENFIRITKTK